MKCLGICLGASTISIVSLEKGDKIKVLGAFVKPHEGNPKKALLEELGQIDVSDFDSLVVTGRKFRDFVNLTQATEPQAVEKAYEFVHNKKYDAVVSAGGETFMVYALDDNGRISAVHTGNKCASGTGEFFLQQIRRMNLDIDEAVEAAKGHSPHRVTGRCSVFCKSDCTHALNKGVPKGEVASGLCEMIAKKIIELLAKVKKDDIMVVGGVSKNAVVMDFLKKEVNISIPKEAPYFEALGAALIAADSQTLPFPGIENLIKKEHCSFSFLPRLSDFSNMVAFKAKAHGAAKKGDKCIIGLDVGSTTTKAVILRIEDNMILASVYLRTNGDPIRASIECYAELAKQIKEEIDIIGLGTTGSGRHIAGLHALTKGIINEIIAHATAAVYFDKDVDTIFEIGGQDAKYTYITSSVPSDYAMNEACSAGTGSFLEESAKESLGIPVDEIADIALKSKLPPNFNDQCAAFISSDIKNASQEGISKEDIIAGLVYSICMNYNNRVKGSRPMGKKIFMQGGVCYNKAVPIAMASLIGKEIIVPPDPGLMGAFGVALEIKNRISLGLFDAQKFDLNELAERGVSYGKSFKCPGGIEGCDRGCEIMTLFINGKKFPFGGVCNKYYNLIFNVNYEVEKLDLVKVRQDLIFNKYSSYKTGIKNPKTIGINKSFLINTYYPFYYNFFSKLGMKVILSESVLEEGIGRKGSSFCYPAEISHGLFEDLLDKKPDCIFLPLVLELPVDNGNDVKRTCVFVQGEPFYLRTAFKDKIKKTKIISPVINFCDGLRSQEKEFVKIASDLGFNEKIAVDAFDFACSQQEAYFKEAEEIGEKVITQLEKDNNKNAIVLFGRSYNAFAEEANMGIPHKFASRGALVIPHEFIPYKNETCDKDMYWATGQVILRAAKFVKKHPQLFGCFVTNFSCGPDSFIISYFRDIMGIKPSLTLELDSHTADAGLNTRIEAALDIIKSYRELQKEKKLVEIEEEFRPAIAAKEDGEWYVASSEGTRYHLTDPKIRLILPSMGDLGSESLAAVFRSVGINASAVPVGDMEILKIGRAHTSCKECLPMIITTGSLLKHAINNKKPGEIAAYFMAKASGPCRFGQYGIYMKNLIVKNKIKDIAIFHLEDESDYFGFGLKFTGKAWQGIVISDVMEDIRNAIKALAVNEQEALKIFDIKWESIICELEKKDSKNLYRLLEDVASSLKKIPLKEQIADAKKLTLTGEIYVRRDALSRAGIVEKLAKKGFVVKIGPISEWIYYVSYTIRKGISKEKASKVKKTLLSVGDIYLQYYEKKIKEILSKSGLYEVEMVDMDKIIGHADHLINPMFGGEAIVTAGLALKDILHTSSGIISIGPFGCMPSRVAEAILSEEMNIEGKKKASKEELNEFKDIKDLPFLAIETDGNPYPQIIDARLETLCLQAERIHEIMKKQKHYK